MTESIDVLFSLLSSSAILPVLTAAALVLLERRWQIPDRLQPLLFIRLLGIRLSSKTNQDGSDSSQQLVISGALGFCLLTLPWLIIAFIMNQFAYYPAFFDAFILFLCLQFSAHLHRYKRVSWALKRHKKQLAKDTLAKMTLRDTQSLSPVGISKGAAESLILRCYYQQITVVFWFVIAGPFLALFYRMALELHYAWNPKLSKFKSFGLAAHYACYWIQWIPVRLAALISILVTRGPAPLTRFDVKQSLQTLFASNGSLVLASQSIATNLHLSGAVMYEGEKFRRQKYKAKKEPEVADMPTVINVLNRTLIGLIGLLFILSSLLSSWISTIS